VIVSPQWPIYLAGMYGTGKPSLFIFILEGVITVSHVLVRYPCGGKQLEDKSSFIKANHCKIN